MKFSHQLIGATLFIAGCATHKQIRTNDSEVVAPATPHPLHSAHEINLSLSISKRQLYVLNRGDTLRKYAVAVGQAKYPTPIGKFWIHQIDWNPEWNPPESDWTVNKTREPPGDPANPMGRVRIVYQMPYTIHGTREISSLGKALSHGSVRMANKDVIELAKFLMKRSGTPRSDIWYREVLSNPKKMVSVKLRNQIPLINMP